MSYFIWFSFQKEGETVLPEMLYTKMCEVEFPGHESYKLLKDDSQLKAILQFLFNVTNLMGLKRTGEKDLNCE
jgi:hypothetical protein